MAFSNPFARDVEGTRRNINAYRALTLLSFLLQFITSIYYTSNAPHDGAFPHYTIFGMSNHHVTPFTPSHVFVAIYWIALWFLQVGYIWHLFRSDETAVSSAASVGSHFILFNLLHFAWIMLWVRSHTVWSEVILVINFFQLTAVYFRNPTAPRLIHLPVAAMPLTFTFFAIFWNGAVMVDCHSLPCRVLANVAIWGIAAFAGFFLLAFKDYYVGFATSFLAAGLGVGQFFTKAIALQWPFAFAVMAITFIASLAVAIPGIFGTNASNAAHGRSGERAPLLQEDA
ncbi:hypothetical protein FN846DRAFT_441077 [Sphaerosporella brunnea]|uniref:DUF1774-domain-containing protein n=1 Tax=Sphaerosporella brunnea TaxID=1250544 RepID=A0A5J5F4Y0_9PEZI|nr:hypothetical protein FN846DRAFT_441077 [Sphaerosporella brunnea]